MTQEQLELYYNYLGDFTNEQFKYMVDETIKRERFFPQISVLISRIEELKSSNEYKADKFASELINNMYLGYDVYLKKYSKKFKTKYIQVVENGVIFHKEQLTETPNELYDPIATVIIERNKERLIHHQTEDNMSLHAQLKRMYLTEMSEFDKKEMINNNPQLGIDIKSLASNLQIGEK